MRERRRGGGEEQQASEALADIALNSLGLILIVLLVYMISFREATANPIQSSAAAVRQQQKQNQQLRRELKRLEAKAATRRQQDEMSGLWRFRIHVKRLVDHNARVRPTDFMIDYFIWIQIRDGSVKGTLFGVNELAEKKLGSSSHANISGKYEAGKMKIELAFTGRAKGGSEMLHVERKGDEFVGQLMSGRHKPGHQNYSGTAIGSRLNESVFSP